MISKHIKENIVSNKKEEDVVDDVENVENKETAQVKEQKTLYSMEEIQLDLENSDGESYAFLIVQRAHEADKMFVRVEGSYTKEEWADIVSAIRKLKNE